jgi:hypothetical protein
MDEYCVDCFLEDELYASLFYSKLIKRTVTSKFPFFLCLISIALISESIKSYRHTLNREDTTSHSMQPSTRLTWSNMMG